MPHAQLTQDDPLDDFELRGMRCGDVDRAVFVAGHGPGVIVMTEMPGISPHVARFARWVRDAGFRVFLPSLFGRDGAIMGVDEAVAVFRRTCVSAEFRNLGEGRNSPILRWLRELARIAHAECGGPGVGAVGMCFTGNFALSMMLEGPTLAPVLCQPTLPLEDKAAIELSPEDAATLRERLEREDLSVLAFRFEGDKWCTAQRFAAYRQALGERFVGRELPDSAAHPEPPPFFKHVVASPHSVVTAHLIDEAGQPTLAARDEIIAFLRTRLRMPAAVAA